MHEWMGAKVKVSQASAVGAETGDVQFVLKQARGAGNFSETTVGWQDKTAVNSGPQLPEGYDPTSRGWYKNAASANTALVSNAYRAAGDGKLEVSFTAPIMRDGALIGVLSGGQFLDDISGVVTSVHPTKESFAFLVDGNGMVILHPDSGLIGKQVSDLSNDLSIDSLDALVQSRDPLETGFARCVTDQSSDAGKRGSCRGVGGSSAKSSRISTIVGNPSKSI